MKTDKKITSWSTDPENPITLTKKLLSRFSLRVREKQFELFLKLLKPKKRASALDVGITPNDTLLDSNFFEKRYPYPENLTAVSIEDCRELFRNKYPRVKFIQVKPNKPLPFKDESFDIVVSWATLEHVGEKDKQKFFLKELCRVGKKVFVTTPDRRCFYELHTGLLFFHWLPQKYFSRICKLLGKGFFSSKKNLNLLSKKDLRRILPRRASVKIIEYKLFKIIPSHLIIVKP